MNASAFKYTPFHERTRALTKSCCWYQWGDYVVPDVYEDFHGEIQAIRTAVSMNEMSALYKLQVAGPDAASFLNRMVSRNILKMQPGNVWYSVFCNVGGKVVSEGMIFCFHENEFIITIDRCFDYLKRMAEGCDVTISDVTDAFGVLAVQGPKSRAVLESAAGAGWDDLPFSRVRTATIGGVEVSVARQGFTGEHGYELWVPNSGDDGVRVWDAIAEAGAPHGIRPAGEYAIEVARVEAGLILTSADYVGVEHDDDATPTFGSFDSHMTPYELGIGHCVKLHSGDFIGRGALEEEFETGPARRFVGLEFDLASILAAFSARNLVPDVSQRVRWDRMMIFDGDAEIGLASSITWSPTLGKVIGLGCLASDRSALGSTVAVTWLDFWGKEIGTVRASVVETPFIELRRT